MAFIPFAFSRTLKHTLPSPPSAEGGEPFAERMVEDTLPHRGNVLPSKKAYPQSALRLTAPSAEGAFWVCLHAKPPLKGEVPVLGRRRGSPPRRTVAAALSAAVTTTKPQETAPTSQAEPTKKKRTPPNASRSSGERGLGGEVLLSEKQPLPPESPQRNL